MLDSQSEAEQFLNKLSAEVDVVKALCEAAYQGNPRSQFALAQEYTNNKQHEIAAYWYMLATDSNYAPAVNSLAVRYEFGEGVAANPETAILLYRRAVELGCQNAAENLTNIYSTGKIGRNTVAKDNNLATHYSVIAASRHKVDARVDKGPFNSPISRLETDKKKGNPAAAFILGFAYEHGYDVDASKEHAIICYEKAMVKGCTYARAPLEQLLPQAKNNFLVQRAIHYASNTRNMNLVLSALFNEALMNKDDARGAFYTAVNYEYGRGVIQDIDRAERYYRMAANLGFKEYNKIAAGLQRIEEERMRDPKYAERQAIVAQCYRDAEARRVLLKPYAAAPSATVKNEIPEHSKTAPHAAPTGDKRNNSGVYYIHRTHNTGIAKRSNQNRNEPRVFAEAMQKIRQ